ALAPIALAGLANCARRRVGPERLVIGSTIVIAGEPKSTRCPKNEECRRKDEPARPPRGLRSEPTVRRIAKQFRRIKWRDVIAEVIVFTLKRRPRRIDDER